MKLPSSVILPVGVILPAGVKLPASCCYCMYFNMVVLIPASSSEMMFSEVTTYMYIHFPNSAAHLMIFFRCVFYCPVYTRLVDIATYTYMYICGNSSGRAGR